MGHPYIDDGIELLKLVGHSTGYQVKKKKF